jgi:tetratricopeptide (TPR) repeat protein
MMGLLDLGAVALLGLLAGRLPADIVCLKNGREIEGLVVELDEERLTIRRAADGGLQSWQLTRNEITSVQLAPPDVAGFRSVARRLETDRSGDQAIEAWRGICVLRPEGVADHLKLVQSYRRSGHFEAAAQAAQTASRVQPGDPRIPLEQGEVALALGHGEEAVAFAKEHLAIAGGGTSDDGSWLLARSLEKANSPEEALAAYRGVLRGKVHRSEALERFTELALAQGKEDQAIEEAELVARSAPDLRVGWIALGKVRYRQGRYTEAVSALESATHLGGPDYDRARIFLQCALARRYDRDPRVVLSAKDLDTARQLDPALRRDQP